MEVVKGLVEALKLLVESVLLLVELRLRLVESAAEVSVLMLPSHLLPESAGALEGLLANRSPPSACLLMPPDSVKFQEEAYHTQNGARDRSFIRSDSQIQGCMHQLLSFTGRLI